MKFTKLCILLLVSSFNWFIYAQTSDWDWSTSINGSSNEDEIDALASDTDGFAYISGKFEDSLSISASPWIHSNGMADIMLAKYDSLGSLQWIKQFGGIGEDNAFDAACNQNNELFISGYFQNTIQFDTFSLTSMGGFDAFLIKLNPQGDVIWAKQFGGIGDDGGNEISIAPNGQIILCAMSTGDFSYDSIQFTNPNHGIRDAFVISVNPDGSPAWIRTISGVGGCRTKSVDVDKFGTVYVGGDFISLNYIVDELGTQHPLNSEGAKDAFITCWNQNGELQWYKNWGGTGNDLCKGIATTEQHAIYLAGMFYNSVDFDTITLNAGSTMDFYIWKLSDTGSSIWLRHLASSEDILEGGEIQNDGKGGVIMGIGLKDTLYLQNDTGFVSFNLPSPGKAHPFFLEYDSTGTIAFTRFADQNSNGNGTFGEISRSGNRVFLDVIVYGTLLFNNAITSISPTNKDAGLVSIALPSSTFNELSTIDKASYRFYPNPVKNSLYISFPNTIFEINLFNQLGQLVLSSKSHVGNCQIDISKLQQASYILQLKTATGKFHSLLIKSR